MNSEQLNDELTEIKRIADRADMIVNGFAFTKEGECIQVVNLDRRRHTAIILGIWRGNPRPFNDRDESAACFF